MVEGQLTASSIIYLFGDSFAPQDTWRSQGHVLESNGVKVQKQPLTELMMRAAIAELVNAKWMEISLVKKGFLIKSDSPILRRTKDGIYPAGGLERALLASLKNDDKENSLDRIVVRLLGTNQINDPWGKIIEGVREHLAQLGFFRKENNPDATGIGKIFRSPYKYYPETSKIASANSEVALVKTLLDQTKSSQGKTWETVTKQINSAFKSVLPQDDKDFDFSD